MKGVFLWFAAAAAQRKVFWRFSIRLKEAREVKLCSDCQEVVEKLDRDVLGGEKELYDLHMIQLQKRAKNPSEAFLSWKTAHFPVE